MYDDETLDYDVSPLTMAILPNPEDKMEESSLILEEYDRFIVHLRPTKIIDNACKFFGSSLNGRLEGTREVTKITHKAPIAIDSASGMYFFPTASPRNRKCAWISHSHVQSLHASKNRTTEVIFKTGQKVVVDISFGSMMNQLQRTAQYRFALENRIKKMERNMKRHAQMVHDEFRQLR